MKNWNSVSVYIICTFAFSDDVHIYQYPKGKILIGLGGSTKLSATVTMASQTAFIKWQKVEVDGTRNLPTDSIKYSGSSCSLPSPELIINDVDGTDNGLYQLCVTALSTTVTGPKVMIEVFGGTIIFNIFFETYALYLAFTNLYSLVNPFFVHK